MILYSIVPLEIVFANNQECGGALPVEMNYMGEKVVVSPLENNRFVIHRIISTSPQAYLNANLQPGTIISGAGLQAK